MVSAAAFAQHPLPPQHSASSTDAEPSTSISAAGRLRSAAAAVLDVSTRLNAAATWSVTAATSSQPSVVQAQYGQAAVGDYAVSVDAVATAQTTASAAVSSLSTVIGIGTMNIEVGSWNPSLSTFTPNPNWPRASVAFGSRDTSLERIRDKINAAGVGVIAIVISDVTGSRLVLRSTSTGQANGFKATAQPASPNPDPASAKAIASLGFDPSSSSAPGGQLLQAAQDAKVSIDGRQISAPQNLLEDPRSGLALRVHDTSSGQPAQIQVRPDTSAMAQDIHDFANAYNDLAHQLATLPPDTIDPGVSTAHAIQAQVQAAFQSRSETGQAGLAEPLGQAGISMDAQGRLQVDDGKLQAALTANSAQVQSLFAGSDTAPTRGLAAMLSHMEMGDGPASPAPTTPTPEPASVAAEPSTVSGNALTRQKMLEQYTSQAADHSEDDSLITANAV
jgi:flagellar hook-associated protein 2